MIVRQAFPDDDEEAMATAMWSMVHGLAFLFLHGKFDATAPGAPADTVRAAVRNMLEARARRR
ncbi:WHG domain-containing protein [Nocardia puris]|uniref:WHG domain-containing protein n=2 Tax=Nocardia puris TaxID=208602 RepID=A0A366E3G5_9NOCA|nr:WHG domain-containing protein [Nocardia puris]RBO96916.1 WHG domain-containing protein [Nocardia puris]